MLRKRSARLQEKQAIENPIIDGKSESNKKRKRQLSGASSTSTAVVPCRATTSLLTSNTSTLKPLFALFDHNPPATILDCGVIQLEGIVEMLIDADKKLIRTNNASLYFESRSSARDLVFVMLYYANNTNPEDTHNLFDHQQNKLDADQKLIKNWRWAFTTCPVTRESFLKLLPQKIQGFAKKWSRALNYDADGDRARPIALLLAYIFNLFYGAKNGEGCEVSRLFTNAHMFLAINPKYAPIRLSIDYESDTIKAMGITQTSFPFAPAVSDFVSSESWSGNDIVSTDHPIDAALKAANAARQIAKLAGERLQHLRQKRIALKLELDACDKEIIQQEGLIAQSNEHCDGVCLALEVGSAVIAEFEENPQFKDYVENKRYKDSDSDFNFLKQNSVNNDVARTTVQRINVSTPTRLIDDDLSLSSDTTGDGKDGVLDEEGETGNLADETVGSEGETGYGKVEIPIEEGKTVNEAIKIGNEKNDECNLGILHPNILESALFKADIDFNDSNDNNDHDDFHPDFFLSLSRWN